MSTRDIYQDKLILLKSYIENLENKIKELKDQITDINERCYIKPEDNEW